MKKQDANFMTDLEQNTINDGIFNFTVENLHDLITECIEREYTLSDLNNRLVLVLDLENSQLILVENEKLVNCIEFISFLCNIESTSFEELLHLVDDYIECEGNEDKTCMLDMLLYIANSDEDDFEVKVKEYTEYLAKNDIFTAQLAKAYLMYGLVDNEEKSIDDYKEAINLFTELYSDKRCNAKNKSNIAYNLGEEYFYGDIVEENIDKAYYFLNVSATLGDQRAKLLLADIYTNNNCLYKEEKVAYELIKNLYTESREDFLVCYDPENFFREASYKLATLLENGIGCEKNEYVAYQLYLESFAAYQSDIEETAMFDDENIDYEEFETILEKLNEIPTDLFLGKNNSIHDFLLMIHANVYDNSVGLRIKELKNSYKFKLCLSDETINRRLLIVLPSYEYAYVDKDFTFTINKKDIINISYQDSLIEHIARFDVHEDGEIYFFDDEENVCLILNAKKFKFNFK